MRWSPLASRTCAALALLIASLPLGAQTATGTISGRVTDAAGGIPIAGASVRVVGTSVGAQSGSDGRFTVRGIPAGTVNLQVNRIGYEAKSTSVIVTAGQS